MVLGLDGNFTRYTRQKENRSLKIVICYRSRTNQMQEQKTEITPYMRTYF